MGMNHIQAVTATVDAADEWAGWVTVRGNIATVTVSGNGTGAVTLQRRRIDPSTGTSSSNITESSLASTRAYTVEDFGPCEIRVGCKSGVTVTGAYEISIDISE